MSAKIDGAQWTANAAIAVINTPAAGLQPAILSISGGDSSVRSIAFAVSPAGTGTYTVSSITMNTNLGLVINNQQWYASISDAGSSGSVTFTTLTNSRAAGTFAFVGVGSKSSPAAGTTRTITEGKFDVTF
ncbi:MAG TPA: DUF6252 family protein [Vicinamibacterales bacterium]|nr:DUF6252 family protein [Vicinamibacterales bacterium]